MKHLYGRAFVDGAIRDDILVSIEEGVLVDVDRTARVLYRAHGIAVVERKR